MALLIQIVHGGVYVILLHMQDDGVSFDIDGSHYTFNGTLTIVPGDNLASQYLGGYKSLASALRKCRHCMAVDDDMQTEVHMTFLSACT